MKRALFLHAGWACVAIAAFVIGSLATSDSQRGGSGSEASTGASGGAGAAIAGRDRGADPRLGARDPSMGERGALDAAFGLPGAGADFKELARRALRDPNPVARRLAFARLLESMTPENARAIREELVALGIDDDEWRDFNYSWGALAGKEAFDFARDSEERDMAAVLTGWASANPSEAIAMIDNLPPELQDQRRELVSSLVSGLADHDRNVATELVQRLASQGEERADRLMGIVAREVMRADGVEAATAWTEGLPDGELKGEAMDEVARDFVRQDPTAAARWAERFADQDYAAEAIEEIGEEWAERDPLAAVGWLEGLPEGQGQMEGLASAFGDWEDEDPSAAAEYLMSMNDPRQRDAAISGFARGYAWQDPEVAIAWAQDISDPGLRNEALTRAGQVFFHRQPDSARAWLQTANLPPEVQNQVTQPLRRRRR